MATYLNSRGAPSSLDARFPPILSHVQADDGSVATIEGSRIMVLTEMMSRARVTTTNRFRRVSGSGRFGDAMGWAVAAAVLGAACSPAPRPAGLDEGWGQSAPGQATASAAAPPGAIPPEQRQRWSEADTLPSLRQVGGRGPSEHLSHRGLERTVRINEEASDYVALRPGHSLPAGALIVQLHHLPDSDELVTAFVMRKHPAGSAPRHADWEYVVLDSQLRVETAGAPPLCARCHLEAPHDSLFGPPPELSATAPPEP